MKRGPLSQFIMFSDEIVHHSLLPFSVEIFCIVCQQLNPRGPKISQVHFFVVEDATLAFVSDAVHNVSSDFLICVQYLNAEN